MVLKKIKIISPSYGASVKESFPMAPPILPYLAAMVPNEIDVELIDMGAGDLPGFDDAVDIVCISVITTMFKPAIALSEKFRHRGVKVVMGGHHPTVCPLEVKKYADSVFIGEAEETFPRFLLDCNTDSCRDFYICGDWGIEHDLPGTKYHVHKRPDLNRLPFPRKDLLKRRYPIDTLQTQRGCPFSCDFCSVSNFFGGKIRTRPQEEVEKEIQSLGKVFYLLGDNCFAVPNYSADFFKLLIASGRKFNWFTQGSLSIVNHPKCDEILGLAAKSGLTILMAGIESLDMGCLEDINAKRKLGHSDKSDLEFTKYAIKKIQSFGIIVWGYFVFGFLNDNEEIFDKTIKFITETNIIPCPILLNLLPGTKLYKRLENYIIPRRFHNTYWNISHYVNNFTPNQIEEKICNFEKEVYSWPKIFRRLFHTKADIKNLIMSMIIQISMKNVYRNQSRLMREYRLPEAENVTALQWFRNKDQKPEEGTLLYKY